MAEGKKIRVLYSFPHCLGGRQIAAIAWHHVNSLAAAGAEVVVCPAFLQEPKPTGVKICPTLAWGKLRIPFKVLGRKRAFALHDRRVARRLEKTAGQIDIVHAWPSAALRTLNTAARLGIASALERPNAHTKFAYDVVAKECERLGIASPPGYSHTFDAEVLRKEEEEYQAADALLCPSDFVLRTFLEAGFPKEKLVRNQYGFNQQTHYPSKTPRDPKQGLTVLFAGACTPRKGLHYALEAWRQSPASKQGKFLVVWEYLPGYPEKIAPLLDHPSVQVLGFRRDLPDIMRQCDILVLPSLEEGSALVTSEARGCGCVLLVSENSGAYCKHGENALVHPVGDVATLSQHMTMLHDDRGMLERLRRASLNTINDIAWPAAGVRLLEAYREILAIKNSQGAAAGRAK